MMVDLYREPSTPEAIALTSRLVEEVEKMAPKERPGGRTRKNLRDALGSLAWAMLACDKAPVREFMVPLNGNWFTGKPIGRHPFKSAINGLTAAGLASMSFRGHYYRIEGFPSFGRLTRYEPTNDFIDLAAGFGIGAGEADRHFTRQRPDVPDLLVEGVGQTKPAPYAVEPWEHLECRQPGERAGPFKLPATILPTPRTPAMLTLANRVRDLSARIHEAGVRGTKFGHLRLMVYPGDALGRLYVKPRGFQGMPKGERLRVLLGGAPVAEVDVKASHLTLALGSIGVDEVESDPYGFPGFAREVVKEWAKFRLSMGRTPSRWPKRTPAGIAALPIGGVTAAVYRRWPSLEGVGGDWQRWQGLEAGALLVAMERLEAPALPVHDSLVVPDWAVSRAVDLIKGAYWEVAGV